MNVYNDVTTEMYGEDRAAALKVIENDQQFDAWLKRYSNKVNNSGTGPKRGKAVSKEEFMKKTAGIIPNPSRE